MKPLAAVRIFDVPGAVVLGIVLMALSFARPRLEAVAGGAAAWALVLLPAAAMLALVLWRNRAGFAAWAPARRATMALAAVADVAIWTGLWLLPAALFFARYPRAAA